MSRDFKFEITDAGKKRESYVDRYTISMSNDGFKASFNPRFGELQDLHLKLTKILLDK